MDSGSGFLAGDESEEYVQKPQNFGLFDGNTIANYDPDICQHLDSRLGSSFIRDGNRFRPDDESELSSE